MYTRTKAHLIRATRDKDPASSHKEFWRGTGSTFRQASQGPWAEAIRVLRLADGRFWGTWPSPSGKTAFLGLFPFFAMSMVLSFKSSARCLSIYLFIYFFPGFQGKYSRVGKLVYKQGCTFGPLNATYMYVIVSVQLYGIGRARQMNKHAMQIMMD
jgi:hypothetical protein